MSKENLMHLCPHCDLALEPFELEDKQCIVCDLKFNPPDFVKVECKCWECGIKLHAVSIPKKEVIMTMCEKCDPEYDGE